MLFVLGSDHAEVGFAQMIQDLNISKQGLIKESEIIGGEVIKNNGGKEEFQEIAKKKYLGIEGTEEFFARINSGDFKFKQEGENYIFEMKYLRVSASAAANFIRRNIEIRILFDKGGNVAAD